MATVRHSHHQRHPVRGGVCQAHLRLYGPVSERSDYPPQSRSVKPLKYSPVKASSNLQPTKTRTHAEQRCIRTALPVDRPRCRSTCSGTTWHSIQRQTNKHTKSAAGSCCRKEMGPLGNMAPLLCLFMTLLSFIVT